MKLAKKIVAVVMSMVAFSSMSAITASAGTMSYSSYQSSSHQWYLSTSYSVGYCAVSCNGTGTYYKNAARATATTGGGNGSGTSGTSATLYNNNGYGWYKCVSNHSATESGVTYSVSGLTRYGTFVN